MADVVVSKGRLLETDEELAAEFAFRSKDYEIVSISKDNPIPLGWVEKPTDYKTVKHIIKYKPAGTVFEDRVWRLFRRIGMERLNTPGLTLQLKSRVDPRTGQTIAKTKQVDVLAVHEHTVFLVECKTAEALKPKTLKAEIAEFEGNRQDFQKALSALLGFSPRLVMVLATANIKLDFNDLQDARELGIRVWGDADLSALEELASLAGQGARYQLYNMVFQGQKIKDLSICVPALKAKMGGHTFYSFVMRPADLLDIAYVHHRVGDSSFRNLTDSYQRMLKPSRIRQIKAFLEDDENPGFFPGNIIINFDQTPQVDALLTQQQMTKLVDGAVPVMLTLPARYGSAWIIDGQHRLYGFADTDKKYSETVSVVAFAQEDTSFQARMFVDINEKQQAVSKNLLWDLYEDLYSTSKKPKEMRYRAISRIAKLLNSEEYSPFKREIAVPKEGNDGHLGFRAVCYPIEQNGLIEPSSEQLFHEDYEKTVEYAAQRIAVFFDVIRKSMPEEWAAREKHFVFTQTGFLILTGILSDIVSENLGAKERHDLVAYRARLDVFLRPLVDHLQGAKKSTIDEYRGGGGAESRAADVREILTEAMGINSSWLDRRRRRRRVEERKALLRDVRDYLLQPEDYTLEFKGSAIVDVGEWLVSGQIEKKRAFIPDSVLKTIAAFLNTAGGDLVLGVLERSRYQNLDNDRKAACVELEDKLVCGVDLDLGSHDLDWYTLHLLALVKDRIGSLPLDRKLVRVEMLPEFHGKTTCVVHVEPAPKKQFVDGKHFYVRRGPATDQLDAGDIDEFWDNRTPLSGSNEATTLIKT